MIEEAFLHIVLVLVFLTLYNFKVVNIHNFTDGSAVLVGNLLFGEFEFLFFSKEARLGLLFHLMDFHVIGLILTLVQYILLVRFLG